MNYKPLTDTGKIFIKIKFNTVDTNLQVSSGCHRHTFAAGSA